MKANIKYQVYRLNKVMGSSEHKALEEVELKGWRRNSFETEEEAIQALIDDNKSYDDYIILKTVYITED